MRELDPAVLAALAAMRHVLALVPDDRVLVITDTVTRACGEAFVQAAEAEGCDTHLHALPASDEPLTELPDDMPPLLEGRTVVINAIRGDVREVAFRMAWLHLLEGSPVIRLGHSPGIDMDMMIHGPLNVDYTDMQLRAEELMAAFAGATTVRLTAPGGTDLVLDLTGRDMISDLIASPGIGCNLPCGEIFCCPVETGADGVLVCDGCFGSFGPPAAPVTFTVAGGRVTDVASEDAAALDEVRRNLNVDAAAATIAELGIGLNPGARLTAKMLEAEKVAGTAHIAFGSNEGMPGGQNVSDTHIDHLVRGPRFEITKADGTTRSVI